MLEVVVDFDVIICFEIFGLFIMHIVGCLFVLKSCSKVGSLLCFLGKDVAFLIYSSIGFVLEHRGSLSSRGAELVLVLCFSFRAWISSLRFHVLLNSCLRILSGNPLSLSCCLNRRSCFVVVVVSVQF